MFIVDIIKAVLTTEKTVINETRARRKINRLDLWQRTKEHKKVFIHEMFDKE